MRARTHVNGVRGVRRGSTAWLPDGLRWLHFSFLFTFLLVSLVVPQVVDATHSVPSPRVFYDKDNDGIADATDADFYFQPAGNYWTSDKLARFDDALSEWRTRTDYDPLRTTSGAFDVYVDGTSPSIEGCPAFSSADLAVTCIATINRGSYFDIVDVDIFLNASNKPFHYWDWHNLSYPKWDAEGIFTHELGHGIELVDLYGSNCPPGPTMCGSISWIYDSYDLRVLTSDDINAANLVYLP